MAVQAFIFPGQGSQAVGMGRDLAAAFSAAREVFEEVNEALHQNLARLMFEGPAEELTLTENTQPALMAHSIAVLRVLEKEGGFRLPETALVVAGHSLGEYTALAAADAFSLASAARLVKQRGRAMQKAVPAGLGAMAALLGADLDQAHAICGDAAPIPQADAPHRDTPPGDTPTGDMPASGAREASRPGNGPRHGGMVAPGMPDGEQGWRDAADPDATDQSVNRPDATEIVQVANDNGAGQVVVSGHRGAVERAVEIAKSRGIRRAMLLPVSAPFHCALMAPAAEAMAEALADTPPAPPSVPLIANVSAVRETDPARIRDLLIQQVTAAVRWRDCVARMHAMGVERFVELGAGKVLTGLIKRIAPDAAGLAAGTPAEIDAVLKAIA